MADVTLAPAHTKATIIAAETHRRTLLKIALAAPIALAAGLRAPVVLGQSKKFAGVTLQGAAFQHGFHAAIKEWLPEFEQMTGIRVNFELQSFPIYNQRMDLELSTKGSAYDFCNVTYPYSGRWIGAGWLTPLDPFFTDPNATPADWQPDDFVGGAQTAFRDPQGQTYGFAWVAGAMIMGIARGDLLEQAGLAVPTTWEELLSVCQKTNKPAETFAFVNDRLHHWEWVPCLMAFGGKVFRDPPDDLMPTLDTPEAARAARLYADLLARFSPPGVLSYTDDQALRSQLAGRANIRPTSLDWLVQVGKSPESKVASTIRYAPYPGGAAGAFPACNSNAYGIPVGSRQKEAAWEFIRWACSKQTYRRMALEKAQLTVPRRSVIDDPAYRQAMTINGQDVAAMFLEVLETSGRRGYMKYRTVPVFPQVGEKINKAIERIASGQASAEEAMAAAQQESVEDLRKAGVRL